MTGAIGIEKLRVHPSSLSLEMTDLCAARGHDPNDVRDNLMIDRRSVVPPWEDSVTLAVNAAEALLTEDDRQAIELLIVGTETSLDQEKPLSAWVHRYLRLGRRCRNFELKHACYSGTAALQTAVSFVAAHDNPRVKALVITTDQSLIGIGEPYEFVCGGGAAAVLVSRQPDFLEIERGKSGVYAQEVSDVIRPTPRLETGNSETSLYAYLEAVEGAYLAYVDRVGPIDFETYFARNVYHVPFGGMTLRAHRALLQVVGDCSKAEACAHWARRTRSSLRYTRELGATYGSSIFVALLGLAASDTTLREGDRVGIFSYGSGSCAEFYSGCLGSRAREVAREAGLDALLSARQPVSVEQYETIERLRDAHIGARRYVPSRDLLDGFYSRHYDGRRALVLECVDDYVRQYEWS